MSLQRWWIGLVSLVALCQPASAQQQSTIAKVEFRNSGGLAQADLETVAGIHAGSRVGLTAMQSAAQHLADTGFFDDVRLESNGSPQALTLIFLLKPAAGQTLYRVVYDNLVWFTPAELRATVHGVAPLLSGRLPENDATLDAVGKALEGALQAKGYAQAQVAHEFVPAGGPVPEGVIHFTVEQPRVRVGAIDLQAVPPQFAEPVREAETKLHDARYVAGDAFDSTEGVLLMPIWNGGYLEAHLADRTVTPSAGGTTPVVVHLTGRVEMGAQYHVGSLQFEPTEVASAQAFAAGQKLHQGDVASPAALFATEAPVERAYRKLGYMYAYVDPGTALDVQSHVVRYSLHVVPGERYTVRSVNVDGLPPQEKAQFDRAWTVKPGDPYDAGYVTDFLKNNTAMRELQGYLGSFQASTDVEKHQVDLTVHFLKTGTGR